MSLYKEKPWAPGKKVYRKGVLDEQGTTAACIAISNKITAMSGPRPDGEQRSILVPFFGVDGFHQALATAARYLQVELEGDAPHGRYFWCHVSEDSKNQTWLVEAGAYR